MPNEKLALVSYAFVKELSESISKKKDKRFFRAKVKSSVNNGKKAKKIEQIRRLLLAATKSNKKSSKKKDTGGRSAKRTKPDKRAKTFTQFQAGSGTGSSSGSSSSSDSESAPDNSKANTEASSATSGSESENGEKINNWNTERTLHQPWLPNSLGSILTE